MAKRFSFFILTAVMLILFCSFVSSYPVGGSSNTCQDSDNGSVYDIPGLMSGGTGKAFGPLYELSSEDVKMSGDFNKIELRIDGKWYLVSPEGYISLPGASAALYELNPGNNTAKIMFNFFYDYCTGSDKLREYSCASPYFEEITCDNGCFEGACTRESSNLSENGEKLLNIDFGVWSNMPSTKVGAAAIGNDYDYWNSVSEAWSVDTTKKDLKYSTKEISPISARLINLGGGWSTDNRMGVKDNMLDNYNYPQNNQDGDSEVILQHVPQGVYSLYVYGHLASADTYGDYELSVGDTKYERRITLPLEEAVSATEWKEGLQYVKFTNINVDDDIKIYIRPTGDIYNDPTIAGLQLIKLNQPEVIYNQEVTCNFLGKTKMCFADNGEMCQATNSNSCIINVKSSTNILNIQNTCGDKVKVDLSVPQTVNLECLGKSDVENKIDSETTIGDNSQPNIPIIDRTVPLIFSNESSQVKCVDSCSLNNKCYPFGYRKEGKFCFDNSEFIDQYADDSKCDNNFECSTNLCVSDKCVSEGVIDKILSWLDKFF